MWYCAYMPIGAPKDITECRLFFLEVSTPKQRQYEALRAFFVEGRPSGEVAQAFGYSPGAFRVMCHQFRRDPNPVFFLNPQKGPATQPKKSPARKIAISMRKQNHSVYEISEALKEGSISLSPTAVREILQEEGFAPLPRRLDDERPDYPREIAEAVADVRAFSMAPRRFSTRCGGLFLFIPLLVGLGVDQVAHASALPGSQRIPREQALRACLALKLWSVERKSHIMSLVNDQGLALFSGLNVTPKKSYFSEYSSKVDPRKIERFLAAWHDQVFQDGFCPGNSFDLDFHSVPYHGEDPLIERHFVSARSRRQPSILVFLARDADNHVFCYSNADIRKGEERDEILRCVSFWKKKHGGYPRHLVFDSQLTTYGNLKELDDLGISFITLRRRTDKLLTEVESLPKSAWRQIELDVPARKFRCPRVYEQKTMVAGREFRQIFVLDLGHDKPTILLTNETRTVAKILTRYAQRMLIENAISDAVRFFHMDALSSAVGMKVNFDMALLVMAAGLYRHLSGKMRGYGDAQARTIFRDLLNTPADVEITEDRVLIRFHSRAHLPVLMASGMLEQDIIVPWWNNFPLKMSAVQS